jgi:hypothetical protein
MELTITQNGALYALQHNPLNQEFNGAHMKRARTRNVVSAPHAGVDVSPAQKLETEKTCFISSGI